jgi:hypothetical protein
MLDDVGHGRVPVGRLQLTIAADHCGGPGVDQSVGGVIGLPGVEVFDVQRPWLTRSRAEPRTPTILRSVTAMSMAPPLECSSDAVGIHRCTSASLTPRPSADPHELATAHLVLGHQSQQANGDHVALRRADPVQLKAGEHKRADRQREKAHR